MIRYQQLNLFDRSDPDGLVRGNARCSRIPVEPFGNICVLSFVEREGGDAASMSFIELEHGVSLINESGIDLVTSLPYIAEEDGDT